jgi:type II secretory pathway predicted ATPase ExeA
VFEQHFGFTQPPFRKDLPPASLFRSEGYVELVTRLRQAAERCHIAVLTGDAGAGKSTALRSVAQILGSGSYRFLYTANATMSARDLYRQWLRDLHMPPPYMLAEARRVLREALVSSRETGKTTVLIVDEAHLLSPAMLEELRMLTNFEMDGAAVFALVLAGHPELDQVLSTPRNQALAQRVGLRLRLGSMTWDETKGYIAHHLQVAGVSHPLLTEGAMRQVFQHSHGIPRRVNKLTLKALDLAHCHQKQLVDEELVELALLAE